MTIKKSLTYLLVSILFLQIFSSCNVDPKEKLAEQIENTEKQLFENNSGVIDAKEAANMINLYTSFTNQYPEDERAASFLFKAADISINVFHSQKFAPFVCVCTFSCCRYRRCRSNELLFWDLMNITHILREIMMSS